MNIRVGLQASACAMAFALAACGGGGSGVGSTPPPPTGSPAPSPTPSPTPAPAPPPPPTGVNQSLDGALQSETFANVASNASARFTADTASGSVSNPIEAQILYDATRNEYRLTTPTGTQTFTSADLDGVASDAFTRVYIRTDGNTTNSLTLTRQGEGITFSYVGSAFWQETVENATTVDGSIDALVYGVKTPELDVPVTGEAAYALTNYGTYTIGPNLFPLAGSGEARVDFASGNIFLVGTMIIADGEPGRSPFDYSGIGQIASGENGFAGTFEFTDFQTYTGTFNGMFFGPAAQELGATWTASDPGGALAVGTFMGQQIDVPSNTQFNSGPPFLDNSDYFSSSSASVTFDFDGQYQSNDTPGAIANVEGSTTDVGIYFDAASNTYRLIGDNGLSERFNDNGSQLDSRMRGFSAWERQTRTYVQGSGWRYNNPDDDPSWQYYYSVFGFETPDVSFPRTGSAGYQIAFNGRLIDPDYLNEYWAHGPGVLLADFAAGTLELDGYLTFREAYTLSGRLTDEFTGALSGQGSISSTASSFAGTFTLDGAGNYTGEFDGSFFGPNAEEVGGTILGNDDNGVIVASFVGGLDDGITNGNRTLVDATEPLDLTGYSSHSVYQRDVTVAYDPANDSYSIVIDPDSPSERAFTVDNTDIDLARSTAARIFYDDPGSPGATGFLAALGDTNPEIQLSYMTFGRFVVRDPDNCCFSESTNYVFFGLPTASALLPRAGTASYSGIVLGEGDNAHTGYRGTISGTSSLTADFGAASLSMIVSLIQDDTANTVIGDYKFNGSIANNGFFGGSEGVPGAMRGSFFGPNADEFGAVWDITQDDSFGRSTYQGVAVGTKD